MSRDTNFYYSFLVLPVEKRRAIVAVWDFCRAVDDAVDVIPARGPEGEVRARAEIANWRAELDRCFGGHEPTTPQGTHLQPCIRRFNLPRQPFEDLLDGVTMDLGERRYETFEDLYEYCTRVASAVGLICLEIFGYRDPRARDYAVSLGVALQLTNIIRDVGVDLEVGRVYLPQEDLRQFGCTEVDLRHGQIGPELRTLLEYQCDRARTYYRRASALLPAGDARRLVAAEIMGAIYFAILRRVERSGYAVFASVIRVPRPVRALIAAATWIRVLALPSRVAYGPGRGAPRVRTSRTHAP